MKRLDVCIFFLLFIGLGSANLKSETETRGSVLELCYKLWKSSSFGWNEKQTERAAWVIRDSNGGYQWQEWDFAPEHRAATWKRPVPEGVIALIHTHPAYSKPEPSPQDVRVARNIKAPVYTVSGFGIWRVGADGKITKEADRNWYRKIKE